MIARIWLLNQKSNDEFNQFAFLMALFIQMSQKAQDEFNQFSILMVIIIQTVS